MECKSDLPKQYEASFDPEAYMKRFCHSMGKTLEEDDIFTWFTDCLYHVFETGKVKGSRLLDVGTGPNIFSVVPAATYCDSITLSDFSPQNRDVLARWLNGSSSNSFSHIFQYASVKEGKGCLQSELELRLKSKIAAVLPVDLLREQPFAPCHLPKFDIITSSCCLECATADYDEYKKVVKRVASLLEIGGHLCLCGSLGCSFYGVGGVMFKSCRLSGEQIKATWIENRFNVITYKEGPLTETDDDDSKGVFFMYGRKLA